MIVLKPPHLHPEMRTARRSIFLAGSIDLGKARDWQTEVTEQLHNLGHANRYEESLMIFNPRRDQWDWGSSSTSPDFVTQVMWEQDMIKMAKVVFFNFEDDSQSPITLMELGVCLGRWEHNRSQKFIVRCSPNFWRYGNVKVMCDLARIDVYHTLTHAITEVDRFFKPGRML